MPPEFSKQLSKLFEKNAKYCLNFYRILIKLAQTLIVLLWPLNWATKLGYIFLFKERILFVLNIAVEPERMVVAKYLSAVI